MEMRECTEEWKSRRIGKGGLPEDYALVMAYMKELRAHNRTRRVYDVNPYCEVYSFRDNVFGLFGENCDPAGDFWQYLIVGEEKAMLIDTGFGLGDMKRLCDELTGGKELIVVNTHAHPDHSYGNRRFDRIFCHAYCVPLLEAQDEHIYDYLFDEKGDPRFLSFDRRDLPAYRKYEIVPCRGGHIFDLGGGCEIELLWVPGHVSGHAMFLDKKDRILFAGDGMCAHVSGEGTGKYRTDPWFMYNNLESYRDQLRKVAKRLDEFDSVFPNHYQTDLPADAIIPAILEACDAILDKGEEDRVEMYRTGEGFLEERHYRFIKGFSMLGYQSDGGFKRPEGTVWPAPGA